MRQKKALVTLNIFHHHVLLTVLPFKRLGWSRRGNLFIHLEPEFSYITDSAPASSWVLALVAWKSMGCLRSAQWSHQGLLEQHTSSFFVPVLLGQVPFLGACSKTDTPHKEWERYCPERTEQTDRHWEEYSDCRKALVPLFPLSGLLLNEEVNGAW